MEDTIGDLFEQPGEVRGEWRLPNFLSLSREAGKYYRSPKFILLDSCWCLTIFPGGIGKKSQDAVGLYLTRLNCDSPVTMNFSIAVRTADKEEKKECRNHTFTNKDFDWGWTPFLKRSELQSRIKSMSPSDALVITYTLGPADQIISESTLCSRLWSMSARYNSILTSEKGTDVVLKLEDGEIKAHRAILESSSEVFARMFGVDMQENQTGQVNIQDATREVFQVVLTSMYSADPEGLRCENACEVYKVAHKYELQELRKLCCKFMKMTLCVDTVCEVVALAVFYHEIELVQVAKDYFAKNKSEIFKSEKWKTYKKDNSEIAFQVLECVFS